MTTMISPAALRAAQNAFAIDEYASMHNDVRPLITALRAARAHAESIVTLSAGRIEAKGFQALLSSRVEKPVIHESFCETVPQIIIGTRCGAMAAFSLDLITNMSATHILCNAFEEWELTFNYGGTIDYWLRIVLPMSR